MPSDLSSERVRLERQLRQVEGMYRREIESYVADLTAPGSVAAVVRLLEQGRVHELVGIIRDRADVLNLVSRRAVLFVGGQEAVSLGRRLAQATGGARVVFDPTIPRAADMIGHVGLSLVQQVTVAEIANVRRSIEAGLRLGESAPKLARRFRDSIGLTASQEAAVDSYETLLRTGSREALDRALRDRRQDRNVVRTLRSGDPIDSATVERMVGRYRERYRQYRALTIAQTEGHAAAGAARVEARDQMLEQTSVQRRDVRRVWRTNLDGRERDSHHAMDGQTVGLDDPFVSGAGNKIMFPGDPLTVAEERVNCRCSEVTVLAAQE